MVECQFEKLYLAKKGKDSDQDIFIVSSLLIQHQWDGIRFLYKSLKMKKCGVVLNDPSCYGKRVYTSLFISSVLPTLEQPVLILCSEGREQKWYNHFQKWTNLTDDAIEMTNSSSKKKVFISSTRADVSRRDWSVLVVDDDVIHKDLFKSTCRTGLRVWLTSSDLKQDLNKFSTFYSWIHPKEKFSVDKFKSDVSNLRDVLSKRVMLDAFLEDTVLRREFDAAPFEKNQDSPRVNVSKKNKDATGTKIKRTKRNCVETDAMNVKQKEAKKAKVTGEIDNVNLPPFDVGVRTITSTCIQYDSNTDPDDMKNSNKMNFLQIEDDIISNCKDKSTKRKVRDIIESDSKSDCETTHKVDEDRIDINELDVSNEISTRSYTKKYNLSISKTHTDEFNSNHEVSENKNGNTANDLVLEKENEFEFKIVSNPDENYNKSEDIFSTDYITNPCDLGKDVVSAIMENTDKIPDKSENFISTDLNAKSKHLVNKIIDITPKALDLNGATTDDKIPENLPKSSSNLNSFELKMKELEEMTLKKFKGSFLDSIF